MEDNEIMDLDGNNPNERDTYNAPSAPDRPSVGNTQGNEDKSKTDDIENEKQEKRINLS